MKKIITITNQKGGVGKTTTAMSILGVLHKMKYRTLGVDMDPQGSLGFSAGVDIEHCDTVYDVFTGEKSIDDVIVSTEELGDILPSNIDLSTVELEFRSEGRECLLRNELRKIAGNYDYIIIDTPPALNVLTMNAYAASGGLIIPMAPEILSVLAVSQIRDTILTIKENFNPDLEVLGILLNRFSLRLRLNREVDDMAQKLAKNLGTKVFRTKIHSSVSVAASPAYAESIITYDPGSKPAKDFKALVKELMNGK